MRKIENLASELWIQSTRGSSKWRNIDKLVFHSFSAIIICIWMYIPTSYTEHVSTTHMWSFSKTNRTIYKQLQPSLPYPPVCNSHFISIISKLAVAHPKTVTAPINKAHTLRWAGQRPNTRHLTRRKRHCTAQIWTIYSALSNTGKPGRKTWKTWKTWATWSGKMEPWHTSQNMIRWLI